MKILIVICTMLMVLLPSQNGNAQDGELTDKVFKWLAVWVGSSAKPAKLYLKGTVTEGRSVAIYYGEGPDLIGGIQKCQCIALDQGGFYCVAGNAAAIIK